MGIFFHTKENFKIYVIFRGKLHGFNSVTSHDHWGVLSVNFSTIRKYKFNSPINQLNQIGCRKIEFTFIIEFQTILNMIKIQENPVIKCIRILQRAPTFVRITLLTKKCQHNQEMHFEASNNLNCDKISFREWFVS